MLFNVGIRTALASAVILTGAATAFAQTQVVTRAPSMNSLPRAFGQDNGSTGGQTKPVGDPECARNGRSPASLLIFPEYDNRSGKNTLFTLTNTDLDLTSDPVSVEIWYIASSNCLKNDFTLTLTPGDTVTLLTKAHFPSTSRGYAFAFAKNSAGQPVSNNVLIGQQVYIEGFSLGSLDWSINAAGFKAIPSRGQPTDIDFGAFGDGHKDLNGVEYESAPDRVHIPRFLGQNNRNSSSMVFIALSGGVQFTTIMDFGIYNDNEEMFSRQYQFSCWDKVSLAGIAGVFENSFLKTTNDAPNEIIGHSDLESGWFWFEGRNAFSTNTNISDPAVYGFLIEGRHGKRVADLPWDEGCRNGALLPTGPLGDNSDQ
jgi:hypothetical protein